jgi:hypothetical protein
MCRRTDDEENWGTGRTRVTTRRTWVALGVRDDRAREKRIYQLTMLTKVNEMMITRTTWKTAVSYGVA